MSDKKKLIHTPKVDTRGTLVDRIARLELGMGAITAKLPEWIGAGALEAAKKVYDELAAEHGRVFEVQEAAFMMIAEQLDRRLRILEHGNGISAPKLTSIRLLVDAIAEYVAEHVASQMPPWNELSLDDKISVVGQHAEHLRATADKNS